MLTRCAKPYSSSC